jgi:hypothetical protein
LSSLGQPATIRTTGGTRDARRDAIRRTRRVHFFYATVS